MSGFSPVERNSAWWSTDTRRAYSGHAYHVVAEKLGREVREDISELEPVRMGLRMQDTIAKFAEEELNFRVKPLGDAVATHLKHKWLRSHGDYVSDLGTVLVECKNYNANRIHAFSEPDEPVKVPAADWAQCCHEAACFGVSRVYLAVLFGGQRFRTYQLDFTEEDKDALVQRMAKLWAHVKSGTLPTPEDADQLRHALPVSQAGYVIADARLEAVAKRLAGIKASITEFEEQEKALAFELMRAMQDKEELQSISGKVLATFKTAKPSRRFDAKLFQSAMPDIYEKFIVEQPGSRRFLLKEKAE